MKLPAVASPQRKGCLPLALLHREEADGSAGRAGEGGEEAGSQALFTLTCDFYSNMQCSHWGSSG